MGRAKIAVIIALLALLVLLTRYSSRQYEIVNWDEDTFMLMAQDVLRGALPYVRLFDNKPPGMFFTLAGVMAVFGQSVSVVRWFGDACVLATALIVFATARRYTSDLLSGAAGRDGNRDHYWRHWPPRYIVTEGQGVPGYFVPVDQARLSAMLAASYSLWYSGAGLPCSGGISSVATQTPGCGGHRGRRP